MNNKLAQPTPRTGDMRLDQLLEEISHPDVRVRQQACVELGTHSDLRVVPWLLHFLDHKYLIVQNSAFEALRRIGPSSIPVLVANLDGQGVMVRCKIMMLLGTFRSRLAVASLIAALKDPHEYIRSGAASGLGMIGDRAAFEPLLASLQGTDIQLAAVAATALGRLGDPRARSPLLIVLRSPHAALRIGSITGLGYLGDRTVFNEFLPFLQDTSSEFRYATVMALGWLGDQRAVPELLPLAQADAGFSSDLEPIAATAAIVIGKLGGEWSLDVIYATIENTQIESLYAWAVRGLCEMRPNSAVDLLINQLQSADAFRRFYAVVALGEIGDGRAGSALMEIAHADTDVNSAGESITDAAVRAIERIRERQHSALTG